MMHIKVKKLVGCNSNFIFCWKEEISPLKFLTLLFLHYFHMAQILQSFKQKKH